MNQTITAFFITIAIAACNDNGTKTNTMNTSAAQTVNHVSAMPWGETDGRKVQLFTLVNQKGDSVSITSYGGTLVSWTSADRSGVRSSILAGPSTLEQFLSRPPYFGAIIGRYGNRIGGASFTLDGKKYTLPANDGPNTLHGGIKGFDKMVWDAAIPDSTRPSVTFSMVSADGDQGFPGNLKVSVRYTLTDENEIRINYEAVTDKATPVNLTNHAYFNLTGDVKNLVLDHSLTINADSYTPVSATLIPTGVIAPVEGTPFDFRAAHKIGERIEQVKGGYDHNWVLNSKGGKLVKVAELTDAASGRKLEVMTTEPGIQFYSGNFLDGKFKTAAGSLITKHSALCLETQHFPDSPNKPGFPNTILQPGQTYQSETVYRLSVQ